MVEDVVVEDVVDVDGERDRARDFSHRSLVMAAAL
jgi:hypothetical protein